MRVRTADPPENQVERMPLEVAASSPTPSSADSQSCRTRESGGQERVDPSAAAGSGPRRSTSFHHVGKGPEVDPRALALEPPNVQSPPPPGRPGSAQPRREHPGPSGASVSRLQDLAAVAHLPRRQVAGDSEARAIPPKRNVPRPRAHERALYHGRCGRKAVIAFSSAMNSTQTGRFR